MKFKDSVDSDMWSTMFTLDTFSLVTHSSLFLVFLHSCSDRSLSIDSSQPLCSKIHNTINCYLLYMAADRTSSLLRTDQLELPNVVCTLVCPVKMTHTDHMSVTVTSYAHIHISYNIWRMTKVWNAVYLLADIHSPTSSSVKFVLTWCIRKTKQDLFNRLFGRWQRNQRGRRKPSTPGGFLNSWTTDVIKQGVTELQQQQNFQFLMKS